MKALLKQRNLNERVSGGLGSYCILNVVMAHLIRKGVRATSTADLGHLLLSLLHFLGRDMDCSRQAISVRMVSPPHALILEFFFVFAVYLTTFSVLWAGFHIWLFMFLCVTLGWHCGEAARVAAAGQAFSVGCRRPSAAWHRHRLRVIQHSRGAFILPPHVCAALYVFSSIVAHECQAPLFGRR